MFENVDNITEDTFEVLEIVGDVAVYATFSGYHNPIMATLSYMFGGDPVMIAAHVVKYNENTVFSLDEQQNNFTEDDGLLHREFFTIGETVGTREESHAYKRVQEIIGAVKSGSMAYSIAPVAQEDMGSVVQ